MSKFYLSNAIPYTNARPHIGHFLEFVLSDAIARYRRLKGDEVYFGLGSDENGQKMWQTARDAGRDILALATENAKHFQELKDDIGISYDGFVRTTSPEHKKASQALWQKLDTSGDLYVKKYKGLYCVGCESFKTEKDLVDGFCPNHIGKPLKEVEEENYFFRLSKYEKALKDLLQSGKLQIIPDFRKNELLNFIESGLEDVSFSRPKSALSWGIEVPNDPDHVMYVWCDALTNYLTHAGYPDRTPLKPWPTDLHVIGKDITRFHALIWQAMLLSAGLKTSKAIFVHEFVTMNGQKMSKTLGNVVDPYEVMERYGSEALRFYLLSESVHGNDLDFTWERFHVVYESKLQNGIGNLVNRVIALFEKINDGSTLPLGGDGNFYDDSLGKQAAEMWLSYTTALAALDTAAAASALVRLMDVANTTLNAREPWKEPQGKEQAQKDLSDVGLLLMNVARMLIPFMPQTAKGILEAFSQQPAAELAYRMIGQVRIKKVAILFPPVEPKK